MAALTQYGIRDETGRVSYLVYSPDRIKEIIERNPDAGYAR